MPRVEDVEPVTSGRRMDLASGGVAGMIVALLTCLQTSEFDIRAFRLIIVCCHCWQGATCLVDFGHCGMEPCTTACRFLKGLIKLVKVGSVRAFVC